MHPITIIATTEPDLFRARFWSHLGLSIFVFDNASEALTAMDKHRAAVFIADYRQLADRWTARRFVTHLRGQYPSTLRVYGMAERLDAAQRQWLAQAGATGVIHRSANSVAALVFNQPMQAVKSFDRDAAIVDSIFARFAGPMRRVHISRVRGDFEDSGYAPDIAQYVEALTQTLPVPDRRQMFCQAVRQHLKPKALPRDADAETSKVRGS